MYWLRACKEARRTHCLRIMPQFLQAWIFKNVVGFVFGWRLGMVVLCYSVERFFQMDEFIGQFERTTSFRGTIAERAQAATFANFIFRARRNGWLMQLAKTHFARAATRRLLQTAKYLFNK